MLHAVHLLHLPEQTFLFLHDGVLVCVPFLIIGRAGDLQLYHAVDVVA
ncbi:MAG: hypothetical protein J6W21_00870 [Bacteroidaceae bacterium]|nr:hypothetical protein [Bacteroidaceae bacterium]